tara:strand:- start:257 stop:454 length:198 start_codon:yes stop_codon:yes gene_type:complete
MDSLMYTEETMKLREQCYRSLSPYLENYPRAVFEFSTLWCEEGNTNADNIEESFLNRHRIRYKSQ